MIFKHYILTRWNLLDAKTDVYNFGHKNPNEWMQYRIFLFDKYCLPSIMNQTCQNFNWLLAFSKKTDPAILKKYESFKNIQIIFEHPTNWLRNNYSDEWLLTSRLDNDDILEPDFIEEIQKRFRKKTEIIESEHYLSFDRLFNIEKLKKFDYRILITYRKNRKNLINQLKKLKIHDFFDKIITPENSLSIKEFKFETIKKYKDNNSIVIGDTKTDIISAKKNNIYSIGVLSGITNLARMENINPKMIINNINEL